MRVALCSGILLAILGPATALAQQGLSARERILACDPAVSMAAAREILNDPRSLQEPAEMFTPALVLFQNGQKDEALFWFHAAQLRARYQLVFKPGDRAQLLQVMLMAVGPPINNYGLSDPENLRRTLDRVLQWDSRTANSLRDGPQTAEQRAAVVKVYGGFHQLQDKLAAEGPSLAQQAKQAEELQHTDNPERRAQCAGGQVDPSMAERETKSEERRVVELMKNHPDVVRAAGPVKQASVLHGLIPNGATMPNRYDVYVVGDRTVFAEVDVARSGREASFTLRCTTSIDPGQRNPFKDACAQ